MAYEQYTLTFGGYCRDVTIHAIPSYSGVYCVYCCTHDEYHNTLIIRELIYIGEAENVKERIYTHHMWSAWKSRLQEGERICFSYANIENAHRERCEAALINHHKPPLNTEYISNFPFDDTTINLKGKISRLESSFKVSRKES
ncbi:hypothetical protein MASR2M64_16640 [Candidatus Cloacimonadota bacterium]|jgi:excinuclease UvrABC nuclease subunit